MNTLQINDDNLPMSKAAFKEFCALVCQGLDPAKRGDPVPEFLIKELHSSDIAEDGTHVRLFDLHGGRTGIQFDDEPIRHAD